MLMETRKRTTKLITPRAKPDRAAPAIVSDSRVRTPRPAPPKKLLATPEQAFGERVRDARIEKGWSQAELAKRMASRYDGWTQSTVAKTEAATRPIRLDEVAALALVLALPLHELVSVEKGSERLQAEAELQRLLLERASLRAWESDVLRRQDQVQEELDHVIGLYEGLQEAIATATKELERVIQQ